MKPLRLVRFEVTADRVVFATPDGAEVYLTGEQARQAGRISLGDTAPERAAARAHRGSGAPTDRNH